MQALTKGQIARFIEEDLRTPPLEAAAAEQPRSVKIRVATTERIVSDLRAIANQMGNGMTPERVASALIEAYLPEVLKREVPTSIK